MPETGPERVGVLADPYLKEHEAEALAYAVEETDVDVSLVVVDDPQDPDIDPARAADAVDDGIGPGAARLFATLLARERWWALVVAERKLADELGLGPPASRRVPVEDVSAFDDAEIRRTTPIEDGNWSELPDEAVATVEESCDVAVRYGFGLLRGDVLAAPEHGVLSFHPADIRRYRGLGPPMAYLDGRDVVGATLQRLTPEIDGGEIVAYDEVDVADCRTLWDVYERVQRLQVGLLADGIKNLADPSFEPATPDSLGEYYSTTSRREFSFAGRVLLKNVRGHLGALSG